MSSIKRKSKNLTIEEWNKNHTPFNKKEFIDYLRKKQDLEPELWPRPNLYKLGMSDDSYRIYKNYDLDTVFFAKCIEAAIVIIDDYVTKNSDSKDPIDIIKVTYEDVIEQYIYENRKTAIEDIDIENLYQKVIDQIFTTDIYEHTFRIEVVPLVLHTYVISNGI